MQERLVSAAAIPASRDGFARWCEAGGIHTVVAGASDVHGIWRGKRLPVADFLGRLERGIPFSDVVLVITHSEDTDEGQELVEPPGGAAYPGYFPRKEQGFPDIFAGRTWLARGCCLGTRARSGCLETSAFLAGKTCRSM